MNDNQATDSQANSFPISPHSLGAERAVLGCLLRFPDETIPTCVGCYEQEFFYDPRHRALFAVLQEMLTHNRKIDRVEVGEWIVDTSQVAAVGGGDYVQKLHDSAAAAADLERHLDILRQKHRLRRIFERSTQFMNEAVQPDADAEALADGIECDLSRLNERTVFPFAPHTMETLIPQIVERMEFRSSSPQQMPKAPIEFEKPVYVPAEIRTGKAVLIVDDASKNSAVAMNIIEQFAINQKLLVGFFSLRLPAHVLAMDLVSWRAGLGLRELNASSLSKEQLARLTATAQELARAPLLIDDAPRLTFAQLRARAQCMISEHKVKLVVIDCLDLVSSRLQSSSDPSEAATVWIAIQIMAQKFTVPVLVVSRFRSVVNSRNGIGIAPDPPSTEFP